MDNQTNNPAEPSKTAYLTVYVLIVGLIFAAVGASMAGMGPVVNLLIAGTQASLLAYFFMHLKGADNLTWLIAGAGLFWIMILFVLLLTDYVTRHFAAY